VPIHPLVGHLVPVSTLVGTAVALLAMTVITVAVRYVDLGEMNIVVALTIAVIKGSLVALFFMHLRWDRPFNAFAFVGSIAFVGLFMGFALLDFHAYSPEKDHGFAPGAKELIKQNAPDSPAAKLP
jgi:cytochrome c oxidase subunit 4